MLNKLTCEDYRLTSLEMLGEGGRSESLCVCVGDRQKLNLGATLVLPV